MLLRMREIKRIIIHCAATPNGREFHVSDIDRWHKERGWRGIGYHYVIPVAGDLEYGRAESEIGAHCRGYNRDSIGICLIGTDAFTRQQWDALHLLVDNLGERYPEASVHGHREFNSHKTCPGFDVAMWLTECERIERAHLLEGYHGHG